MSSNFATACHAYEPSIVIIGAGFAGVAMAHRLKNDGFTNATSLEDPEGVLRVQIALLACRWMGTSVLSTGEGSPTAG